MIARRKQARIDLLDWLKAPATDSVFGIGDEWTFDYPVEVVKLAWNTWRNSGYGPIPAYEDIASHDPAWVSDLLLMDKLHRWVNPQEEAPSTSGDGASYRFGDIGVPLP